MKQTFPVDGEALKRLRNEQMLNQKEAAEMIGISPQHLSELERGLSTSHAKTVRRIASAYNVSPSSITREETDGDESNGQAA